MTTEKKEIVPHEGGELVSQNQSPSQLIALAIDRQADPDTLSKLLDLQERYEAGQARKLYVLAMTAFKRESPAVMKKTAEVDFTSTKGRTAYNYANLGSIVQEVTTIMSKHGLSASWETRQESNGNISVTCHITHSAGHRESVTLAGPPDDSGNKNRIQAVGSTVTYLQRYTLLAALGLATGDDDDGRGGKKKPDIAAPKEKAPAEDETITTGVNSVTQRNFKKADGSTGTKYIINAGEEYETFSETFAKDAKRASEAGLLVTITYTTDKWGRKIKGFTVLESEPTK
jgi:hypothetical protein